MINYLGKLIEKTLRLISARNFILLILIGLFAYSVAGALSGIMSEKTLGSIFRHFLPTTPYLFLIILIGMYDIRKLSFSSFVPSIPSNIDLHKILKWFIPISLLGYLLGLLTLKYSVGLLLGPVAIFLITSLLISTLYMTTGREMLGVIIYIGVLPFLFFIQGQFGNFGLEKLEISRITISLPAIYLTILSLSFFVAQYQFKSKEVSNEERRVYKICVFFALVPLFSIILSDDPVHSFIFYIVDIVLPLTFFLILRKSIKKLEDIKIFICVFVISIAMMISHSLYFIDKSQSSILVKATMGFTLLLPLIVPLMVAVLHLLKRWQKYAMVIIIITFIIYIFIQNSRSGFVALILGLGISFYLSKINIFKKTTFFLLGILILVWLIFFSNIEALLSIRAIETIKETTEGVSLDLISSQRTLIWRSALKMIADHPFFGIGPGMWDIYIPDYSLTSYFFTDDYGGVHRHYETDSHNFYLMIFLNYGVFSLICYILLLIMTTSIGIRNMKKSTSKSMSALSMGALISLSIWMLLSLFGLTFFEGAHSLYGIMFWSIVAIILKINSFALKGTIENLTVQPTNLSCKN